MTLYVFCPDQFTTATHLHIVELCSKLQRLRSSFLQKPFFQNFKSFICLPSTALFQAQSALLFSCPQFRIAGTSLNTDCCASQGLFDSQIFMRTDSLQVKAILFWLPLRISEFLVVRHTCFHLIAQMWKRSSEQVKVRLHFSKGY